jgi:hypothetical protein
MEDIAMKVRGLWTKKPMPMIILENDNIDVTVDAAYRRGILSI